MNKVENVLEYYVLTNKLKDVVRSGWKYWNVKKERLESIAEHIYGTCMLAIAVWSETLPSVNLAEVLMTLAVHETEEIIIGDMTMMDKGYEDKKIIGEKAVEQIFKNLMCKEIYITLIKNFDNLSTPEAVFAYKCDKLECDIQAKLYDEICHPTYDQATDTVKKNPLIIKLKDKGLKKMCDFFLVVDKIKFKVNKEDEEKDLFYQIHEYLEKNEIKDLGKKTLNITSKKEDI